jgi:hypothetical protein
MQDLVANTDISQFNSGNYVWRKIRSLYCVLSAYLFISDLVWFKDPWLIHNYNLFHTIKNWVLLTNLIIKEFYHLKYKAM